MASPDVNSVADQLAKTSVVSTEVSFAGQGLKLDREEDAKEIVDAINAAEVVESLRLEGNTLGVEAAGALAKALEKRPEFKRALWSDMFTGRMKTEIPPALKHLGSAIMQSGAQLVELDLSDNAFGPNGMNGLTELLVSSNCFSLEELKLNNNGLGVTGGKMLAKCLMECYEKSSKAGKPLALKVFVSGRGRLENDGSIALAEPFKAMGSLEEVSMPQNGINHQGIAALADAFASNKNLKILNLNDNTFTEKGAQAMAKTLPNLQQLEVVNFGDCLLRTDGGRAIAKAIMPGHSKLRELTLSFNEIKKYGGVSIAESLEGKDNLEKLELDGNQFGEEGVELVQGTLEAIGKLECLGSLSDDEGDSEDEDEDDDDEEEEPEEDQEGEHIDGLEVKGISLTPRSEAKPVSAADFLQFPSPTKLQSIGPNRAEAIVEQLGDDATDVNKAMKAFMKVCSVVSQDDADTIDAASECADAILKNVLTDKDSASIVINALLVHLGLLKGEEKVLVPKDLNGPLIVLSQVVKKDYFPSSAKDMLQFFTSRPNKSLDAYPKSKHRLLQALFS